SSVLLTSHIFSFLSSLFYIIHRRPPISPLFPYTTLFRSIPAGQIFVIGDSHIGLAEGSEKPICTWLDRFVTLQPRALYLNGDLRSEEHTSELQSLAYLVCRLLLEKKKIMKNIMRLRSQQL